MDPRHSADGSRKTNPYRDTRRPKSGTHARRGTARSMTHLWRQSTSTAPWSRGTWRKGTTGSSGAPATSTLAARGDLLAFFTKGESPRKCQTLYRCQSRAYGFTSHTSLVSEAVAMPQSEHRWPRLQLGYGGREYVALLGSPSEALGTVRLRPGQLSRARESLVRLKVVSELS